MQHNGAAVSNEFLFAKLHGMWAEMIVGATLHHLVHSGGITILSRILQRLRIRAENRAEVQKKLISLLVAQLSILRRLQDSHSAYYYQLLGERFFFDDLKTILHYYYFPSREVDINILLTESPKLPALDAGALLRARNVDLFYQQLPAHPAKERFLPILVELDQSRDVFAAECRLDQIYYELLYESAAQTPRSMRSTALALTGTEIDLNNLIMVLRNAQLYHLPASRVEQLGYPQGRFLTPEIRAQLWQAGTVAEIMAKLPVKYRKLIENITTAPLYVMENRLWRWLHELAYAAFHDYDKPARSIAAFPYLKFYEIQDLSRAYEGFHFKLSPADIESMMIGVGHV